MSVYIEQVNAAIEATTFVSPSRILWFGAPALSGPSGRIRSVLPVGLDRACLLTGLQALLYQSFYCQGEATPSSPELNHPSMPAEIAPFVQRLSEANCGAGYLEPGWELRGVEGSELLIARNDLEVRARLEECQLPAGVAPSPGASISVRFPKEFRQLLPGFYFVTGNRGWANGGQGFVRVYWNLTADGVIHLVRAATRRLNDAGLAFQLKALTYLGRPRRCDATVLYLRKENYDDSARILQQVHAEVSPHLSPAVPALTKPLAPGVGLAEDPGHGLSFGEHRCRLLAEGLLRAQEAGRRSLHDRSAVVHESFAHEGIDVEKAPYVNPGSEDVYRPWPFCDGLRRRAGGDGPAHAGPTSGDQYLSTAIDIGRRICGDAVWSGDRCSWMGHRVDSEGRLVYEALGPEVYGGTSGVAMFLAELCSVTGEAVACATALGAMRQALSRAEDVPPSSRLGLFSGWTGLALAAARVGLRTGDESLLVRARYLLQALLDGHEPVRQPDLISGAAGAIPAWLTLHEMLPDVAVVEACARLGDELIDRADKTPGHWSWRNPDAPRDRALTGFSHGAAGIGTALFELFRACGEARYRDAATQAFRYERRWFDAAASNWPDFRGVPARSPSRGRAFWSATVWCHGAPGIALSRLRAHEITGDPSWEAEAVTALRTTREETDRALESSTMGFSLCHGFAGNAEILLAGARRLGDTCPGGGDLAVNVARTGIERYGPNHAWPGGAGGPTPSLMLGQAGIGYFYLRLHDPEIPSVLFLTPGASPAKR